MKNWNDLLTDEDIKKLNELEESTRSTADGVVVGSFSLIAHVFPSLVPYILNGEMSAVELEEWTNEARKIQVVEQTNLVNALAISISAALNGDPHIIEQYINNLYKGIK